MPDARNGSLQGVLSAALKFKDPVWFKRNLLAQVLLIHIFIFLDCSTNLC